MWGGAAHSGIIVFDARAAGQEGAGGARAAAPGGGGGQPPHFRGRVTCASEVEVVAALQRLVEEVDPDVVCGFDIQRGSIGYILDRCAYLK